MDERFYDYVTQRFVAGKIDDCHPLPNIEDADRELEDDNCRLEQPGPSNDSIRKRWGFARLDNIVSVLSMLSNRFVQR